MADGWHPQFTLFSSHYSSRPGYSKLFLVASRLFLSHLFFGNPVTKLIFSPEYLGLSYFGWLVPDLSKKRTALVFNDRAIKADCLAPEDEGATLLRKVGSPSHAAIRRHSLDDLHPQKQRCNELLSRLVFLLLWLGFVKLKTLVWGRIQ